jgi:hypothetical protein
VFGFGTTSGGASDPYKLPSLQFCVDAETGVSGTVDSALNSILDQSTFLRTVSNTAGAGTRPVWSLAVNAGANSFSSGTKHGIDLESGADWLTTTGLDTAPLFTCPTAMTVFHTTRHNTVGVTPTNAQNCPQNVIGCIGSTTVTRTSVGFSAGTPRFITWDGAAYQTYNGTATTGNNNAPHTVCWVYSGTKLTCYFDGVLDSTQTVAAYQATNGFNGIGGHAGTDGLIGAIAAVAVWNAALSPAQIKLIHNRDAIRWF